MSVQVQAGSSLRTPMSFAEYQALGETKHHEYYDGLTIVNPPSKHHVQITKRLTRLLDASCPPRYEAFPEFGWQPVDSTMFEPDVVVAATDAPGQDALHAPPLLVVEVTSRSTRSEDLGRKMRAYAEGGAPWYWIADSGAATLTVYRNDGSQFVPFAAGGADRPLELSEPFPITLDLAALCA
jgi:Uma2 family endonuclease